MKHLVRSLCALLAGLVLAAAVWHPAPAGLRARGAVGALAAAAAPGAGAGGRRHPSCAAKSRTRLP